MRDKFKYKPVLPWQKKLARLDPQIIFWSDGSFQSRLPYTLLIDIVNNYPPKRPTLTPEKLNYFFDYLQRYRERTLAAIAREHNLPYQYMQGIAKILGVRGNRR